MANQFNSKSYSKLLTNLRDSNMKSLDYSLLAINLVFILKGFTKLPAITLFLVLVCYQICTVACDLGLEENYKLSNRLFSLSDWLNYAILLCTIVSLVIIF